MSEELDNEFRKTLPCRPQMHDEYDRAAYNKKKMEWLESRLTASEEARKLAEEMLESQTNAHAKTLNERDRLREAASEYQEAASDALYGQGDKEDNASAYDKADEQLTAALAAVPKERGTCKWMWDEKARGYHTPHGQLDTSGWNVKGAHCSVCGLPIVEKPGKEG